MNVLFYVLDSLRKDHLSAYGYSRETAPNISQLAGEGVVFEKAFSQATWTRPSAGSILSGCYPAVHGAVTMQDRLSDKVPTLPYLLQGLGFKTAGYSAMANVSSSLGFNRGFGSYIDIFWERNIKINRHYNSYNLNFEKYIFPTSEDINHYFVPWLRAHAKSNFFAFLWSIDTHIPYLQGLNGRFYNQDKIRIEMSKDGLKRIKTKEEFSQFINLYDSQIYYNDYQIGEIIKELKRLGIYEKTIIVIVADHGECFNDHRIIDEIFFTDALKRFKLFPNNQNYRIKFHFSIFPYDELINVPLIIKFPDGAFGGQRIDALVQLVDIAPSVLDYLRVPDELWVKKIQGKSLMPLLKGDVKKINEFVFSHCQTFHNTGNYYSVRNIKGKLILTTSPQVKWNNISKRPKNFLRQLLTKRNVYFDLTIGEDVDLLKIRKKEADHLYSVLMEWIKQNDEHRKEIDDYPDKVNVHDKMVEAQLKAMGYLD